MTKKRIIIFSLVVLIFLALGSYALAQPVGTEATLLVTDGQVIVSQPQNFFLFNRNQQSTLNSGEVLIVQQGDSIEVTMTSSAVLTMGDGTSVELYPDTVVQISELVADDTNFRVRLSLLSGKVVSRVQRLLKANDMYKVQTPSSTASVRGTVFAVDVRSNQETFVSVDEGIVAVQMGEQEVLVEAGFEVTAVVGQPLETQPQSLDTRASLSARETAVNNEMSTAVTHPDSMIDSDTEANPVAESSDGVVQFDEADAADNHKDVAITTDEDQESRESTQTAVPDSSPGVTSTIPPTSSTDPDQSVPSSTATPVASGSTSVPPTPTRSLPTNTSVPPTATSAPPTKTPVPPPPTNTSVPPPPPTKTPVSPPPPTNTSVPPPLPTNTSVPPPPPTNTPVPPPPTNTPLPPSPPTNTPVPPLTATPEPLPPPTDEPKVTLCHKGNTIEVDQSSVQAHLDHGDYLGECN